MAKPIKLTQEQKLALLQSLAETLNSARMTNDGIKIEKRFTLTGEHKCTVQYTANAWYKTIMLIENQPDEVGWHGVCHRDAKDKTLFHITDILLYPQKVTDATINPDPIEYANWMNALDDDTFNHMRAHIHSHVYMPVTPSGPDQKFRDDRLSQLSDDDFYIFQIMNKEGNISSAVYDFQNNIFYENKDVSTTVECDDMNIWETYKNIGKMLMGCTVEELRPAIDIFLTSGVNGFLTEAKNVVTRERTAYNGYGSYNKYGNRDDGYRDYRAGRRAIGADETVGNTSAKGSASTGSLYALPPADSKPGFDDADDDDLDAFLREKYGDDFADEFGDEIKADPFFSADDTCHYGVGTSYHRYTESELYGYND